MIMLCFICSIELSVAGTTLGAPLAASLEVLLAAIDFGILWTYQELYLEISKEP